MSEEIVRSDIPEGETEASNSESEQKPSKDEQYEFDADSFESSSARKSKESITVSDKENNTHLQHQEPDSVALFGDDSSIIAENVEEEKQTEQICQEMELKMYKSSESTISCDQIEEQKSSEPRFSSENIRDSQLAHGDVRIDEFLRNRDEPESGSNICEQGSIGLEPLTASEILECEASEILQKGSADSSAKTDEIVSTQMEDIPDENSFSTTETNSRAGS